MQKKSIGKRIAVGVLVLSLFGSYGEGLKIFAQEQETILCEDNICRILTVDVPDQVTVYEGQNVTMNITKSLQDGFHQKCVTSDASVATVSNKGEIKGLKKGTVTITTTIYGEHVQNKLEFVTKVTVKKTSIKILAPKKNVKVGKTLQLSVKKEGITDTVSWSVDKKKVATIGKNTGKLKGKSAGTVKVTAKCGSLKKALKLK